MGGLIDGIDEDAICGHCGQPWGRHLLSEYGRCRTGTTRFWNAAGSTFAQAQLQTARSFGLSWPAASLRNYDVFDDQRVQNALRNISQEVVGMQTAGKGGRMRAADRIYELKNFKVDALAVEELLVLLMDGKRLREGYEQHDMAVPEWLTGTIQTLTREVARRRTDDLEKRRRELIAADAADLTASERREARKAEREKIEAQLAGTTTT